MALERLCDIFYFQKETYPLEKSLAGKENGAWRTYSTDEVIDIMNKLSLGLLALGIGKNDKIGIMSGNRPEWTFIDQAILQIGAINVPVYPNINENEIQFIFSDADVKMVFVSNEDLFKKVRDVQSKLPSLKHIFTFNKIPNARHWKEVVEAGKGGNMSKINELKSTIKARDLATIIYTSGTTGEPKGVMLSHNNVVSNVLASHPIFPINHGEVALSFLPLNHIFERMVSYLYMSKGVSVYFSENTDTIVADLKEVKPQIFTTVPRLLEKVYERIVSTGLALTGIKRALFFWALNLGLRYDDLGNNGFFYNLQLSIANKLIFVKWREALGGSVTAIISGGAALQPRLAKVFTAGKIPVLEGYGLTETSPVISVNHLVKGECKLGTVGMVLSGVTVKFAEDGEICAKGPNVMMGYYNRPDRTKEVIDSDGYFHTGDIGEMQNGKFLKITDRKKELFKTSGGKYVAPSPIENKMKESFLIEQMMVIGEGRKFVSALIVPSIPHLKEWCSKNGIEFNDVKDALENPLVLKEYADVINEMNQNFSHIEQVKRFKLLPDEWTIPGGELTPTLKLKRKVILEKYKNEIAEIYRDEHLVTGE
jgi:long-chain acyl-CoA synthetase